MNILDKIIASKKIEVAERKKNVSTLQLEKGKFFTRETHSLHSFLLNPEKTGIIAEYKRKSPSKGIINDRHDVIDVVGAYSIGGASAVSILTDLEYFGGNAMDVMRARTYCDCPILRKDFIVDSYQILEAKSMGADVILLIAACLEKKQIKEFSSIAQSLGLETLLELHDEEELKKIDGPISIVGINNRNLKTFVVDIQQSIRLAEQIPSGFMKISESGIDHPETIKELRQHGFQGFLIGENFMKTNDPGKAFVEFSKQIK